MKAECPMGHTENLSFEEMADRLQNNDWECRHDECSKEYSYELDSRFWDLYNGEIHGKKAGWMEQT